MRCTSVGKVSFWCSASSAASCLSKNPLEGRSFVSSAGFVPATDLWVMFELRLTNSFRTRVVVYAPLMCVRTWFVVFHSYTRTDVPFTLVNAHWTSICSACPIVALMTCARLNQMDSGYIFSTHDTLLFASAHHGFSDPQGSRGHLRTNKRLEAKPPVSSSVSCLSALCVDPPLLSDRS